jgi:hypothetical protein
MSILQQAVDKGGTDEPRSAPVTRVRINTYLQFDGSMLGSSSTTSWSVPEPRRSKMIEAPR